MQIGPYEVVERIGVGGMAEVFRGIMRGAHGFERAVAIKRILPQLADDDAFVAMFVDEAKISVQLQHPNIVQILDLGRADDGQYYIAMEHVSGRDLRAVLDRLAAAGQRIPLQVALHVAQRVCEALHHAHFAEGSTGRPLGIVHRDVSPQNVLLSYEGEVKVTDFGLAKAAGRATQTQQGIVKGKLAYMSPEQLRGEAIDHRSDVYAVGILLWELATGQRLFMGANDRETIEKVHAGRVQIPSSIDPELPEALDSLVMAALSRERDHRFQTAEQLHDALSELIYSEGAMVSTAAMGEWLRETFDVQLEAPGRASSIPPEMPIAAHTAEISLIEEHELTQTMRPPGMGRSVSASTERAAIEAAARGAPSEASRMSGVFDDRTPVREPRPEDIARSTHPPPELDTTARYDSDLLATAVASGRAPAVEDLTWNDDEDQTIVGPGSRR